MGLIMCGMVYFINEVICCVCLYQNGFEGFACELCKDSNMFGSYCNESKAF